MLKNACLWEVFLKEGELDKGRNQHPPAVWKKRCPFSPPRSFRKQRTNTNLQLEEANACLIEAFLAEMLAKKGKIA